MDESFKDLLEGMRRSFKDLFRRVAQLEMAGGKQIAVPGGGFSGSHDDLSDVSPDDHHDPVTLGSVAITNVLDLNTQDLTLDTQVANTVFAGPSAGADTEPTFRALVDADIPDLYVKLDGSNQASWIPNPGVDATQDITGHFNLSDAAYTYKISDRHALSMPGTRNLLAGDGAGAALTTGTDNVIAGYNAGAALIDNAENVIIGSGAGGASGYMDDVVLIGYAAMSPATSVGAYNAVVIGDNSGGAAEIMDSVVIGSTALRDATALAYSSADVIIGSGAVIGGTNPYKGDYNVIIGAQAAPNLEDAASNVLVGYGVARAATTATRNVVIGTEAGEDMLDAWVNVILGWRTGYQLTDGDYNTLVGARAGAALTTGATMTMLGYESGLNATGDGGVFLGHQAGYYETGSNKLFIDNAARASEADARVKALIYGVFDAATANQYLTLNGHLIVRETATFANTGLHLLDTNASHDLIIAPGSDLTADRTLTITTGDADRTLTLANSGTAVMGTGTATRLAEWSDANTIAASTLIKAGAGVLTLDADDAYTLTVPATGTAALLATANVFTAAQKVNVNSATAFVVEQDGVKDNVLVVDTANARVGINVAAPAAALDILGDIRVSGTEEVVANKAKHEIYLSDGAEPLFRRQTYYWNGTAWVATAGYGFGYAALSNNTGASANGFGHIALQYNTGAYANGFGYRALYNNTGARANGFGYAALSNNTGASANGFGLYALYNNTGASANGFGYAALQYNQASDAIAIGDNAWSSFLTNSAGAKTFDYTAIDPATDRITITAHGFGATGAYVNLQYTQGTSAITGLTTGGIYQVKVVDANTIGFYEADGPGGANRGTNITDAGTGTGHTLTPQYTYTGSVVIGHDTNPTKAYQVILGSNDIVETVLRGKVLVNTTTVGAQLAVDQSSATGALPVLLLDQGDVSEEFIRLIGTSAADDSQSFIDAADLTTPGTLTGWIKVYIQDDASSGPVVDGYYYVPFYTAPTA